MNFISESEVEAAKKKRAEEWEEARAAGRQLPEEEPETVRDNRPLYEKLKEQKDKKQEEFEEQLKFKNMIYKGLNEEDAQFLSNVAKKQAEMDGKRFEDESGEIAEFRAAAEKLHTEKMSDNENKDAPKSKIAPEYSVNTKSQASMLASSIIRKRKSSSDVKVMESEEKQQKISSEESPKKSEEDKSNEVPSTTTSSMLSLVADYSSDEESS